MSEDTLAREKGQEGTMNCPTCGSPLALTAQADGGVSAETCKTCYGGQPSSMAVPKPETAAADSLTRETGTNNNPEETQ